MQWLLDNGESLLALVGGVFMVLRIIVALTPTPKDDQLIRKAQTKVQKILGVASKLMGIDTTQGVGVLKTPPAVPISIVCCILTLCCVGCTSIDPILQAENGELNLTQKSFASTVRTLTVLNEHDTFSEKEQDRITIVINQVDTYLRDWETSNLSGVKRPDILRYILPLLTELENYAGVKKAVPAGNLDEEG